MTPPPIRLGSRDTRGYHVATLNSAAPLLLRAFGRWWLLLLLCPLVAGVSAAYVSSKLPPVYEAQASLLVRPEQLVPGLRGTTRLTSQQIVATYANLMTERPVLQRVLTDLDIKGTALQLAQGISVAPVPGTTVIDVRAQSTQPAQAAAIANTVVVDFIATAEGDPNRPAAARFAADPNFVFVGPALTPTAPISPKPVQNVGVGTGAGLLLAIAILVLAALLDQAVNSGAELQERTGLTALGEIPWAGRKRRLGDLVALATGSAAAEAYRRLRTNLTAPDLEGGPQTLLVTSPEPRAGKSRTAANLALALAGAGHRTVLVDADLRRPGLARLFGVNASPGLVDLLRQESGGPPLVEVIPGLWLLPAAAANGHTAELLGSRRMADLIESLRRDFAFVVIDTTAVNSASDAAVLAVFADATILVVEHERTGYQALARAAMSLGLVGAPVLGVVVNKVRRRRDAVRAGGPGTTVRRTAPAG